MPNLRPLTPAESEKISAKGFDPGEYVADDSGRAINRAAIASMDAGGLQQSFGLSPRDAGIYSQRGPITSALTEGLSRMGAGLFGAGEKLTGIDKLGELRRESQNVAEIMASKRQPGGLDTALGIGAGLATQVPLYVASLPAAAAINAFASGGEGAQRTEEAGGTGGQQVLNAVLRGGTSALTDIAGAKFAVPAAKAIMQSAKPAAQRAGAMLVPAAFGAAENVTAQVGANVADKVTFNPNKDLMEGTATSALVGFAIPAAVGARQAFGGAATPTISPRAEVERFNRMSYDERVAALPELNKRLREAGKPEMTLEQFGGPAGNRLSPDAIQQFADLALTTGEGSAMGSPNEQLAARAIKSGIIRRDSPTLEADVRAVFNIGETALRDIQLRALNEGVAGEQANVASTLRSLENQTKIGQSIDKRQADVDAAMAAAEASRRAEAEKLGEQNQQANDKAAADALATRQAGIAAEIKNIVQGKAPYAPDAPLAHLASGKAGITPRPMSAEQTLLAERELAQVEGMKARAAEQTAQQAVKGAVQTAETLTPAPESAVTAIETKAPTPAAAPENATTAGNAKTAVTTAPVVPKVGKDAAIKPGAPSQAAEGSPSEAGKSAPAPTSVALPGKSPTSSALSMPTSTPNPSTAAVVEAGGAKAATPVNPQVTSALPQIPEDVANKVQTVLMDLWQRDRANPLRQQLVQLSQDVQAGRQPLAALTSALPKTEVASPVATVKAEPAVKTEAKLTDAKKAELQAELAGESKTPLKEGVESDLNSYVKRRAKEEKVGSGAKMTNRNFDRFKAEYEAGGVPPKVAAPAPLKIKSQQPAADPVAADRATLAALGLEVRPGKRGNWELYDKSIDEVRRDLGGMADEVEAVKEAARITREESGKGIGSKMRETRQDEAGFVINPAELIEAGGRAVAAAARPILTRIRSATNQLGDHATRTGNETAAYGHRKLNETATVAAIDATKIINESQSFWNKLSSAERGELTDVLQYERAWRKEWPSDMSPKVKQAYLETRNLMRELGERAGREGPRIQEGKEWRPLIVDEFWVPEALSAKVVKELQDTSVDKATGRPKRDIKLDEFRDWARQNGLSDKQIDTEIKRFDIENKTADADLEFDALHRPMTIPLPPGWAGNTQDAINRYATKYAFEMARHKYIDQDTLLGPMSRGQRESLDDLGRLTQRLDEAGQVGDTTDALFRAALNSFALQVNPGRQTVAQRLSSVANPLAVQTGATIRDTVNMFGTLVDDAGVKNSIKGVLDGVTKYRSLKERGLVRDTGNLSGDAQRVGEAFENGQVLETFRDALRAANRMSGVDALNKFMQAVSSAAGVARAKEAMAKNDEAFFKKVGIPEWRSKTPAEVEDFVARWVVEGSQGSMGAKDQPTHLLKGSGAGAQFFPIMKWAFAFSNQQIDRAWKPLMDASLTPLERVKPLATRLAGAAGASAVANTLLQTMLGRDDRNPTFKEWEAAGYPNKLKYLVQKMSDLQVLPAITAFANVVVGNQQMPRNLGVEVIPNLIQQAAALQEIKRDYSYEDYVKAVDALADKVSSNWRDLSKVATGETKDEIEQARARYEGMNTAVRPAMAANPLNLATQFNKAKTVDELKEIAQRIVSTANLDTPDVSVKGPSEDAAFDKWLELSNPELSKQYRKQNTLAGAGLDQMYETKKVLAEAVNKALEQKKLLLMSKEPNAVQRAKALKIDWKEGGKYEVK